MIEKVALDPGKNGRWDLMSSSERHPHERIVKVRACRGGEVVGEFECRVKVHRCVLRVR